MIELLDKDCKVMYNNSINKKEIKVSEEKNELIFFHFGEFKTKKEKERYFQAYKEFKNKKENK